MRTTGIGIDIVDVQELEKKLSRKSGKRFLENTFTAAEVSCAGENTEKLASAFAAKEAVFKAFGTGWIEGKEAELLRDPETGIPHIRLHGELKRLAKKRKVKRILVSVSWTGCCAAAVVLLTS